MMFRGLCLQKNTDLSTLLVWDGFFTQPVFASHCWLMVNHVLLPTQCLVSVFTEIVFVNNVAPETSFQPEYQCLSLHDTPSSLFRQKQSFFKHVVWNVQWCVKSTLCVTNWSGFVRSWPTLATPVLYIHALRTNSTSWSPEKKSNVEFTCLHVFPISICA